MEKNFKKALGDYRTEAVVLRVASPGGEVVASDEIASVVASAKEKKPIIVSMGYVAASGGYLISAPATRIFASSLTLTGSIGVFLGKFNVGNLYKKLELHKEILTHAPFAGLMTEHRPWTAKEREILVRRLDQYYDGFVTYVAEQRHLSRQSAEAAAKGRVWLGADAKVRHLTDESGGYYEAVRSAASEAGVTGDDYEVAIVEDSRGLLDFFGDEGPFMESPLEPLARGLLSEPLLEDLRWMERLRTSPFLYLSPLRTME